MQTRSSITIPAAALVALLAGCASVDPMEADREKCSGFGFQQGTRDYANCMMRLSQQRDAQDAQRRVQQEHDQAITDQMEKDRQAEQDARDKAAADQRYEDWLEMSGHGSSPPPPQPRSDDDDPNATVPSGVAIPGMNCTGEGVDMACDAR
jgi:hypothetical protein